MIAHPLMPELVIDLDISADKMLAFYRGDARVVKVRATNGQTIAFPVSVLRRYVVARGVYGRFRIEFDDQNKFIRIDRAQE